MLEPRCLPCCHAAYQWLSEYCRYFEVPSNALLIIARPDAYDKVGYGHTADLLGYSICRAALSDTSVAEGPMPVRWGPPAPARVRPCCAGR